MPSNGDTPKQVGRNYAVLWSGSEGSGSGRLEVLADRLELSSGTMRVAVPFGDVADAHIARGRTDRLRGLPVLSLHSGGGEGLRIASLEGTGALHEIARYVEEAASAVRASGT